MKWLVVSVSCLLLAGCARAPLRPDYSPEAIAVSTVAVDALMQKTYAVEEYRGRPFVLCFPEKSDPPNELLARLSISTVLPCSALQGRRPIDAPTIGDKRAITAMLYAPRFASATSAKVNVYIYLSVAYVAGRRIHVEWQGNKWVVVGIESTGSS